MIETMFCRKPVRIDAIVIAVMTPITIPSTVRKLLNLCERTLSSAIRNVSRKTLFEKLNFIDLVAAYSKSSALAPESDPVEQL
jgi:hypothetical protein